MKPEKPYENLLNRDLHIYDVEKIYKPQLEILKEVVNYGTNLIMSCFNSSDRDIQDTIVLLVLFKQIVSMLDSYEVLVSNGCVPTAYLQCRAMFESFVYIKFILKSDRKKRALYYYVSTIRKEIRWSKRSLKGTEEYEKFTKDMGEYKKRYDEINTEHEDENKERIKELNKLLQRKPYVKINEEFESYIQNPKGKKKRKYEPNWYQPIKNKNKYLYQNVRQLSEEVEMMALYKIFYEFTSEIMHTSNYQDHIKLKKETTELRVIRDIREMKRSLEFALTISFKTYEMIINTYRPGQIREFVNRYENNWWQAFRNIPKLR